MTTRGLELLSEVSGPTDVPVLDLTVDGLLKKVVFEGPNRPALVFPEQKVCMNYGELDEKVELCALGLLALGLNPGDRVGMNVSYLLLSLIPSFLFSLRF